MAKEIEEKKLKKEKKDKKEKKEKRAETDGVSKPKKEKKEKKSKDVTDALEAAIEEPEVSMMEVDSTLAVEGDEPSGALVPFAFPLADNDKEVKKILKTVKKCMLWEPLLQAHLPFERLTNARNSCQDQDPPPRCQGSCQGSPQVARLWQHG